MIQIEKSGTLCPNNDQVLFTMQGFGDYIAGGVSSALKSRDYKDATDLVVAIDCRNGVESPDVFHTLQAKANGGQSLNSTPCVRQEDDVRRLTPLECERLQGFPLIWEWLHGKGSCLWASEIEEFPIAVTKLHFPEEE